MEPIRSDMGPRVEGDLGIGARRDERLQDRGFERVLRPGIELAVRIGSRAAFAKEQIRLRIEIARARETRDSATSSSQIGTAIDQVDTDSVARERPCRIQAGGSRANDDDTTGLPEPLVFVEFKACGRQNALCTAALQCSIEGIGSKVLVEIEINVNHEAQDMAATPPACVQGTTSDSHTADFRFGDANGLRTPYA
jgi:hypothetical protein